jgi:hypothetical protein
VKDDGGRAAIRNRMGRTADRDLQDEEFLGVARHRIVRMKPAHHESIDALDGGPFGFRADLEKFVIIDVGVILTMSAKFSPVNYP